MGHDTVTRFALDETMAADAGYGVSRRRQGEADWIRSEIVFQKRLRFLLGLPPEFARILKNGTQ